MMVIILPSAFAQSAESIEITEKSNTTGKCIELKGNVNRIIPGNTPVTIQVFSPIGNLVDIRQIEVNDDGVFEADIAPIWKESGEYTMKMTYGKNVLEDTLDQSSPKDTVDLVLVFDFEDKEYYFETSADIENTSTEDGNTIHFDINKPSHPCLTKGYFYHSVDFVNPLVTDYEENPKVSEFLVLVNGEISKPEIKVSEDGIVNTIIFPVPYGSNSIDITVTKVVPEFGTIVMAVLIVAVMSIIILSRKSTLLQH